MSDARKQELLNRVAETINNHKMAREQTESAIAKAQKKRAVKPKKYALLTLFTITTISVGNYLYSSHQAEIAANQDMRATPASLLDRDRCIDGLIQVWPDGEPICKLTLI